jgi:hypothetical protein
MIIFVEGNKVDISEFINDLKRTILLTERSLKINLDVMRDKVNVIEEMHRIMCEQDKKIKMFENKLDSEGKDAENCDTTLKRNIKVAEEKYANIKLKYDSLVDQVRELKSLNLDNAEKILKLEAEKKKLYDELQLEKAINRRYN